MCSGHCFTRFAEADSFFKAQDAEEERTDKVGGLRSDTAGIWGKIRAIPVTNSYLLDAHDPAEQTDQDRLQGRAPRPARMFMARSPTRKSRFIAFRRSRVE